MADVDSGETYISEVNSAVAVDGAVELWEFSAVSFNGKYNQAFLLGEDGTETVCAWDDVVYVIKDTQVKFKTSSGNQYVALTTNTGEEYAEDVYKEVGVMSEKRPAEYVVTIGSEETPLGGTVAFNEVTSVLSMPIELPYFSGGNDGTNVELTAGAGWKACAKENVEIFDEHGGPVSATNPLVKGVRFNVVISDIEAKSGYTLRDMPLLGEITLADNFSVDYEVLTCEYNEVSQRLTITLSAAPSTSVTP